MGNRHRPKQHPIGPVIRACHAIDAVVNAIGQIDIPVSRRTKEGVVALGATAEAMTGRFLLRISLGFYNYAPQQLAAFLAFHQPAANQVGSDHLSGAGEKALGKGWGVLGGYGSGLRVLAS